MSELLPFVCDAIDTQDLDLEMPPHRSLAQFAASRLHPSLKVKAVRTLDRLLDGRLSDAELKGWMNRSLHDVGIRNAKSAGKFLRELRQCLADPPPR